jgi:hypothetical protein
MNNCISKILAREIHANKRNYLEFCLFKSYLLQALGVFRSELPILNQQQNIVEIYFLITRKISPGALSFPFESTART